MATSLGLIECETMPQGVGNGPAEFQNAINDVSRELIQEGKEKIYIDDLNLTSGEYEGKLPTDEEWELASSAPRSTS